MPTTTTRIVTAEKSRNPRAECSIAECSKPAHARSWCLMHYGRWQRNGNPHLRRRKPSEIRPWLRTLPPMVPTMMPPVMANRGDITNATHSAAQAEGLKIRTKLDLLDNLWVMVMND